MPDDSGGVETYKELPCKKWFISLLELVAKSARI
jgi:hypothetical protein